LQGVNAVPETTDEFFNLNDPTQGIRRELAPGITTRIFPGEQAMLSVVRLEPHAAGKMHHHSEEQWGVLLEGSAVRIQGDQEIAVETGDFWRTPANLPHTMRAGPSGAVVLDIFSPPRVEYGKPGTGFGAEG
jgi:quercetin dioxygenase-like cupin family protein